jgi:hypothetical protein
MTEVRSEWDGDRLELAMGEGCAGMVIELGGRIARTAKTLVHVNTGTLMRSIHAAPLMTDHTADQELARGVGPKARHARGEYLSDIPGSSVGEDLQDIRGDFIQPEEVMTREGAAIEVGSWVDYACVEETGRHHQYMQPAAELELPTGFEVLREQLDVALAYPGARVGRDPLTGRFMSLRG